MRAIILDDALEVSRRASRILVPLGVPVAVVGSAAELPPAIAGAGPQDLLVVNLTGGVDGGAVAAILAGARFEGRTLVLVDHLAHPAVSALAKLPRAECLPRPPASLDAFLDKVLADAAVSRDGSPGEVSAFHGIVGTSRPMQEIFARIEKVAAGDANVCIWGESGTGKELIARAIHRLNPRRDRPFVTLDCTAVPDGLLESHLFGHVKGAFTGAVDHRDGVFALAHSGTLFIDELGELSLPLQAKLLRVIQTREFTKVGGVKPLRVDVRLLAATNKDLKREVEAGRFREDLYYRVAVVMLHVPPLRDRPQDIPLLVDHFLARFAATYTRPIRGLSPAALDRILASPWPGNVRQLENVLEQAVVLADSDTLAEHDLSLDDRPTPFTVAASAAEVQVEPGLRLDEVERRYILRTLHRLNGNRTRAAKALGISVRCLQYKLKAYFPDSREIPALCRFPGQEL